MNRQNLNHKRQWGPEPRYPSVLSAPQHDGGLIVIAGPCSVESPDMIRSVAKSVAAAGATYLRGGIYRAGTYPPAGRFGLVKDRVRWLAQAGQANGLPVIAEVLDVRLIEYLDIYVDAFQVGARHCQDYALLNELSKGKKPVTLKRGMGMTLDEFLGAAEYLARGSCQPILIERGSSTHMNHVRWDLSVSLIAAVKRMTGLPILVDACHGTGRNDLVEPMTLAGIAAGADGFLVECHPKPEASATDTEQAYPLKDFEWLKTRAEAVHNLVRESPVYTWNGSTIKRAGVRK